ncbi:hypothetical protein CY35_08G092900 [Sphagnum magellanicum]|nr:hypothetical protein CY35_08G092900 [Sphagnum magellanicum]
MSMTSMALRNPQATSTSSSPPPGKDEDGEDSSSSSLAHDEAGMENSCTFLMALQELQSLRPRLYSAAEHCESSYLYNHQKQVVLDHLKNYSMKALVNVVDYLSTVAYKLNDLLVQQTTRVSAADLQTAALAQRFHSCQEHCDREGLKQQTMAKTMPVTSRHYALPDHTNPIADLAGKHAGHYCTMLRESFDFQTSQPHELRNFHNHHHLDHRHHQ